MPFVLCWILLFTAVILMFRCGRFLSARVFLPNIDVYKRQLITFPAFIYLQFPFYVFFEGLPCLGVFYIIFGTVFPCNVMVADYIFLIQMKFIAEPCNKAH